MTRQLAGLRGVEATDVELATGRVRVLLATDSPATREALEGAIGDSGFTLHRIEMPQ